MCDTIQHGGETWVRQAWYEQRGQELMDALEALVQAEEDCAALEKDAFRLCWDEHVRATYPDEAVRLQDATAHLLRQAAPAAAEAAKGG